MSAIREEYPDNVSEFRHVCLILHVTCEHPAAWRI